MRRTVSTFVFAAMTMLLPLGALGAPYLQEDLEALDRSGTWDELRAHLTDIPPGKRGPRWNEMAEHACLQPEDNYHRLESCARLLNGASAADPKNKELTLRIAIYFGRTPHQTLAIPFFARAITEPNDPQCGTAELDSAAIAGLMLSPGIDENKPLIGQAQKLAFDLCWAELKQRILTRFDREGSGVYLINTCPALRRQGALTQEQGAFCDREDARHQR